MAQNAPGKHHRKGITLAELFKMFPDDKSAEEWFVNSRWPDGVRCPHCDSENVKENAAHPTMPFRCNSCKKQFSAKTNTVMRGSKVGYQKWVITLYLMTTNLKGVSSMKLHRDLGVTQKTAWHMVSRIRKAYEEVNELFDGEVEVDESYFGGKEGNKHAKDKLNAGRGTAGKTPVVGIKDRETNQVKAQVVPSTNRPTLQAFVTENTTPETIVYTDEASAYSGLPREHVAVKHSVGEYVREQAHTNGLESFWSVLKRGFNGTFHHISPKHLHRYIGEFSGRHNDRPSDTIEQMTHMVQAMEGKRLRYADLISGGPAYPQEIEF
jgi:transposase-like protein